LEVVHTCVIMKMVHTCHYGGDAHVIMDVVHTGVMEVVDKGVIMEVVHAGVTVVFHLWCTHDAAQFIEFL